MATLAKNTVLKIGDGAMSEAFTQILKVTSIKWDGRKWSTEKTTNHDNATPVETFQPTLYTNGNVSLTIDYDPANAQHARLRALSLSGAANNFQLIQVAGAEEADFAGYVTSFVWQTPVDGLLKADINIQVNDTFNIS